MQTENLNITGEKLLLTPNEVKQKLPLSASAELRVIEARQTIRDILSGKDSRVFLVVGPCSIHDIKSALEYAEHLTSLSEKVKNKFFIVMRAYFEKPRTTIGWKGFINDPDLDDSFKINEGLLKARDLLVKVSEMGLCSATEALDPIIPQYLDDLIAWYAIGARTTESQTHRELASGLSTPVGFKNGTDGNIQIAVNAMLSAKEPHHFLGINQNGQCTVMQTKGNSYGHIVLRGGTAPNYDSKNIEVCVNELAKHSLPQKILVDCSHGNSLKDHNNQPKVFEACVQQIKNGSKSIFGMMIESHLFAGNQKHSTKQSELKYGVSITDACIDWKTTENLILNAADALSS
jgi:3-deoxy-7-phosphoheptulonate synthase